MRLFYFDLVTGTDHDRDELGIMMADLDEAYLEACRAAVEISRELLLTHDKKDPNSFRFELYDQQRNLLLEVPFREVLNPGANKPVRPMAEIMERLRHNIARGQQLKAGISAELDKARQTMDAMNALLTRPDPDEAWPRRRVGQ